MFVQYRTECDTVRTASIERGLVTRSVVAASQAIHQS